MKPNYTFFMTVLACLSSSEGFVFIPLNGVFLCYTLSLHFCVKCSPFSVFKDRLLILSQLAGLFATA